MKELLFGILLSLSLFSCRNDPDPVIDYCKDAIDVFKDHIEYEGLIYFCNAQPPLQAFIPGIVTATFPDSNTVSFHIYADSINFDTTIKYGIHCAILEQTIPSITLNGQTESDIGGFLHSNFREDYTGFIHINFGYPNCLSNTAFEGLSK